MDKVSSPLVTESEISLTFMKGLEVLRAFDESHQDLTVAEIAQILGFTRAATRRLVRTLEVLGYVRAERQRYRLTPRSLKLGLGFLQSRSIGHLIGPVLREEALTVGESISLAMLDGEEAIYVFHAPTDPKVGTAGYTIGSSLSLTDTITGRAILAFLPPPQRGALSVYAELTLPEQACLVRELETIREQGYAWQGGLSSDNLSIVGVPAFNIHDEIAGALSIVFPPGRYTEKHVVESMIPQLQRCAKYISTAL